MAEKYPSKIDQLLDLLLEALQERQANREIRQPVSHRQQAQESFANQEVELIQAPEPMPEPDLIQAEPPAPHQVEVLDNDPAAGEKTEYGDAQAAMAISDIPERLPSIHLDWMLGRLAIVLLVLIVLINIPFNRYGTSLARAMPDRQALVIRDGLLLKGEGDEIYVLKDNHKRWISSLDAFTYYGYHWDEVNLVDDAFLDQFPSGPALSILYKCADSPHVFAVENGYKRWIKDIPTFEAQGYVWDDVQMVSCAALEEIPSGLPIPTDAGEPPAP